MACLPVVAAVFGGLTTAMGAAVIGVGRIERVCGSSWRLSIFEQHPELSLELRVGAAHLNEPMVGFTTTGDDGPIGHLA
jgi:hypothetical protein